MKKDEFGVFSVVVPAKKGGSVAIPHNSKVKVSTPTLFLIW
jgi:1,4-alpha-glucan branching enzyme